MDAHHPLFDDGEAPTPPTTEQRRVQRAARRSLTEQLRQHAIECRHARAHGLPDPPVPTDVSPAESQRHLTAWGDQQRRDKHADEPKPKRVVYTPTPPTDQETSFRHSGWSARRDRIRQHLAAAGESPWALDRWDCCGGGCVVEWSPSLKRHRCKASYCHARHCEPCMRAKANRIAATLRHKLADAKVYEHRLITLTLRHSDAPLADQIKRLYSSFKKLRTKPLWKTTQKGGAATLEVKWSAETRQWHPHLHVISQGKWIPARELSEQWHQVTGDSMIVDVTAIREIKDVASYMVKYVTKGINADVWIDDDAAQEWISASRGVRVCGTFGTWRGFALLDGPETANDWTPVGTLTRIITEAQAGAAWAAAVLLSLRPPGQSHDADAAAKSRPPPNENLPAD